MSTLPTAACSRPRFSVSGASATLTGRRLLASRALRAAVVALAAVWLAGCGGENPIWICDSTIRTYGITMERTLDVKAADVVRDAVDVGVDHVWTRVDLDAGGGFAFSGGGSGQMTLTSAPDGRALLRVSLNVPERRFPKGDTMVFIVTVQDAAGNPTTASGALPFHGADSCHTAPDRLTM